MNYSDSTERIRCVVDVSEGDGRAEGEAGGRDVAEVRRQLGGRVNRRSQRRPSMRRR